jgi:transcriptional regulator GlxA family with amidase domain
MVAIGLNICDIPRMRATSSSDSTAPGSRRSGPRLRVGFILLDQFTLAAFSGLIDALRLAADYGGRSRQIDTCWKTMTLSGHPRRSSCGVAVVPDADLLDPTGFDYIAVCGGNNRDDDADQEKLSVYLRGAVKAGVKLIGVCCGTFAIARAGLVGSRHVCIHWNAVDEFRERYPAINATIDRLFIDEDDLITCAGSTAAIDLGLYLVEKHCGRGRALQVVRHMVLQDVRPPSIPQAHFYESLEGVRDMRVRYAVHFIEQRVDSAVSIDAVARFVGLSRRQLERAFRGALGLSPAQFHRKLRLSYGRWLLENSSRLITQIALDCGFADAAHFTREFRAEYGRRPSEIRKLPVTAEEYRLPTPLLPLTVNSRA